MYLTFRKQFLFFLLIGLVASRSWADGVFLYPDDLVSKKGSHSDQPLTVLELEDQTGNDDDWRKHKYFYTATGRYTGTFDYSLPTGVNKKDVTNVELRTNYRGPTRSEQRWRWKMRNFNTGKWVLVGDNQSAGDFVWTSMVFSVPGNAHDYLDDNGRLKVRYLTRGNGDQSTLDYLALRVETEDASSPPPPPLPGDIWQPRPGSSWQWQLTGNIDTSVDAEIYDIDLFDVSQNTIDTLHAMGRKVICYFSAGSWENWRPDAGNFPESVKGRSNGWAGEKWLDIRQIDLLAPIMRARLELAADKKCDAVEPDNIDGYSNNSGFSLGYQDQLAYNTWLAAEAHDLGLSIGLKNDLEQVEDLLDHFDWALNEECFAWDECDLLSPFVDAGKAVFGVEYEGSPTSFCPRANAMGMEFLKKRLDLDAWRIDCHDYQ